MRRLIAIEKALLIGHIVSMAFGLAGLLLVLPHPEFVANLPDFGKTFFAWSMAGGGCGVYGVRNGSGGCLCLSDSRSVALVRIHGSRYQFIPL